MLREASGADVLKIETLPVPEPGPGEILIPVHPGQGETLLRRPLGAGNDKQAHGDRNHHQRRPALSSSGWVAGRVLWIGKLMRLQI